MDIASLDLEQLQRWFVEQGEPAYRGRQVFGWLHARGARSWEEMTDLSKPLRARLEQLAPLRPVEIVDQLEAEDGTIKFLCRLFDGLEIESVWMPEQSRRTLCLSTQVGCAMRCAFCATGTLGLKRNLSAGEIAGQVEAIARHLRSETLPRPVSNVVYMGMGEPLANLEATIGSVQLLLHDLGENLSRRHVTVSTIGLVPAMREFVRRCPVKLAVSLNASGDEARDRLMPVNRRFPLAELLAACRSLALHGQDRITFEYVLLRGVNDGADDARRLVRLLSGLRCKVNLIPYNPFEGLPFERPDEAGVLAFQQVLVDAKLTAFIRRSRGQSLQAACGQLVARRSGPSGSFE